MKKLNLFYVIAILAVLFVSCKPESEVKTYIVDFEDVTLTDGIYNGSDLSGTPKKETAWGEEITNYYKDIVSGVAKFQNTFTKAETWTSWLGFAISNKTDQKTVGYMNQYSVYASGGALGSKQFAVAFKDATVIIDKNEHGNFKINSLMLNNSTYAYLGMKNGEYGGMGKKFETDDWFKVTITGSLNNTETGKVDYYLADFRDGKKFVLDKWTKVDMSALGEVDKLTFEFASSDVHEIYGMNTPAYVCVDNLEFTQEIKQ